MTGQTCADHILLVGFMGAGKSSVSRRLSRITGLSLIDLDKRIESLQHKSISAIFDEEGEEGFRRIETDTLRGLSCEDRSIVSCGGGIVGSEVNRQVLGTLGTVIYLEVSLEEAVSRISHPETRPMLSGPVPVEEIFQQRLPLYEEVADITVRTAGLSVPQVACKCKSALDERGLL